MISQRFSYTVGRLTTLVRFVRLSKEMPRHCLVRAEGDEERTSVFPAKFSWGK